MRFIPIIGFSVALLGGCAPDGEILEDVYEAEPYDGLRFERLSRVPHDGSGVFPTPDGRTWVKQQNGVVLIDPFDGSPADWRNVPLQQFDLRFVADDTHWLESEGALYAMQGEELVDVDDVPTLPPVGIEAPRESIAIVSGPTGIVGIDTDQVLYHYDPEAGEVIAEWEVQRPQNVTDLKVSADGRTLVVIAERDVVFYDFNPDGLGFMLYEYESGGGSVNPGSGSSGGSGDGGSGGGSGGSTGGSATTPCPY